MNERDENIIVCLAASVGGLLLLYYIQQKSSKKKKASVGQEMVTGTAKRKWHIMELFQTFA